MQSSTPFEMMESFFERMNREGATGFGSGLALPTYGDNALSMDVTDRPEAYDVTVDVPGYDREDVDVRVEEDTLSITAEHEHEHEDDAGPFIHRERSHRTLRRSIDLPTDIDRDGVAARLTNGVLTVTLPKRADDAAEDSVEIAID